MRKIICVIISLILSVICSSCGNSVQMDENIWDSAIYMEDTELGDGKKTMYLEVSALEKSITVTVHSDKKTVGEALIEHGIVEGEEGPYGLYVKTVNGMLADYDVNQSYWAFTKNGESLVTGVDGEEFNDGDKYELTYVKN